MMFRLKDLNILGSKAELALLPDGKLLINTINAHSYNTARKDRLFAKALMNGDVLIPDGVSIVKACRWIKAKSQPKERIAGWDLFSFEMENLERKQCGMLNVECGVSGEECGMLNVECGVNNSSLDNSQSASADNSTFNTQHSCSGKRLYEPSATFNTQHSTLRSPQLTVMFMGSSEKVLDLIVKRAAEVYPHLKIVTYSPPYKPEFSEEDNKAIIDAINAADPDLLWIGMTAPKQEKWTFSHWDELNIHCHVGTIGAVFDFFAGTVERAPVWWQRHGLEWLYRLLKEPKRMWRRYIIGNALFLFNVIFRER
ncbi:WecB/TagA/CpsF family glycosyltransferase [Leyella stercorea]|uniref:WecB/TagA/CpsF family glycosyltransferase n=1 Tax=Leyella stercorea TaxID=363265 RepID=UPI00243048F9|nr:WecB/TagA/CpsF family glycosyltransferase [Leyella stercorea]